MTQSKLLQDTTTIALSNGINLAISIDDAGEIYFAASPASNIVFPFLSTSVSLPRKVSRVLADRFFLAGANDGYFNVHTLGGKDDYFQVEIRANERMRATDCGENVNFSVYFPTFDFRFNLGMTNKESREISEVIDSLLDD